MREEIQAQVKRLRKKADFLRKASYFWYGISAVGFLEAAVGYYTDSPKIALFGVGAGLIMGAFGLQDTGYSWRYSNRADLVETLGTFEEHWEQAGKEFASSAKSLENSASLLSDLEKKL